MGTTKQTPQERYRLKHPEMYREAARKWREANPEKAKQSHRNAYARLRERVTQQYGSKCGNCGLADPRVLQIDHVNGGGTQEHEKLRNSGVYRRALKYPENYQLLCANCNWIKRSERNENVKRKGSNVSNTPPASVTEGRELT